MKASMRVCFECGLVMLTVTVVTTATAFVRSTTPSTPPATTSFGGGMHRSTTTPSSSSLFATVEQQRSTSSTTSTSTSSAVMKLIPPESMEEMMANPTATADSYEAHIQKTYARFPLTLRNGKGCRLYATDGTDYLDCVSGIATCALGHANPSLIQAINQQMEQCHHVSNLYLIPAQAALANWLTANSIADKVFFCNSGAEANEAAIKCARRHAHNRGITKPVIITAEHSFHGRTLATVTATGQAKYHKGFDYDGRMVEGFMYIPYNDITALENAIQQIQQSGQGLAAIMMEALQGEGGIIPGNPEFFTRVREICNESGALMICDEVQVGMGRSGKLWGYQHLPVTPDIFTSAKALGGGVPIGAMMAAEPAASVFGPGDHASTYGGNPLACAAGVAVAKYLTEHNVLQNVQDRGHQLVEGLKAIQTKYTTLLGDVRGWGLMLGIEVIHEQVKPVQIVKAAMDNKLLLVGAGSNVIRFVPPLIITEKEIEEALTKFEAAVAKVATEAGLVSP